MSNQHNTHVAAQPATIDALSAMMLAYVRLHPDGVTTNALLRFQKVDLSFNRIAVQASLIRLLQTPCFSQNAAMSTPIFGTSPTQIVPTSTTQIVATIRKLLETQPPPPDARPSWDRRTHTLSFGRHNYVFKSNAAIVVSILDAFEESKWEPIEEIRRWIIMKEQLSRTSGKMPESKGLTLEENEVRDGLTVLKRRTKDIIGWHQKGCGASWERHV